MIVTVGDDGSTVARFVGGGSLEVHLLEKKCEFDALFLMNFLC